MKIHPVALAVAAAAGGAAVMVVSGASGHTSSAQSTLNAQLLTNQRISQAAVRRANTALNYMGVVRTSTLDNQYGLNKSNPKGVTPLTQVTGAGQGWQAPQIRDGQVTGAKVADGAVTSSKVADGAITQSKLSSKYYSAYVNSAGTLQRATPGITGVTKSSDGIRTVSTNFDASACAATASVATAGAQRGIAMTMPPATGGVTVYTYSSSTSGGVDLAFQVTMVC